MGNFRKVSTTSQCEENLRIALEVAEQEVSRGFTAQILLEMGSAFENPQLLPPLNLGFKTKRGFGSAKDEERFWLCCFRYERDI
jgi:hypothetical protein